MTKKITRLDDYIGASDTANLLSQKLGRPILPKYMRTLARRKRQPVHTQQMGNRLLYHREDILACTVKQKVVKSEQDNIS
jgi:hypothetical protein